jgi:hypothetical protein
MSLLAPAMFCQENNDNSISDGNISLHIRNINFVKNNEYFNPLVEGYTLIGYFLQPSLVYSPSEKISLKLGVHLLNYSGAPELKKPDLVFSTTYKFTPGTSLTIGTLPGCDSHRMSDPLFNSEKLYTDFAESGIQFVSSNGKFFTDTWINWQNFIFRGDTTREVFTAGESFVYNSPDIAGIFSFHLPVQLLFKHYGGQISNYAGHVITYFNGSAGIGISAEPGDGRLGKAGIEYRYFLFRELTEKNDIGITNGHASWLRLNYRYKPLSLYSGLWKGTDFYAPEGNRIFSSVSDYSPGVIIHERTIWTSSLHMDLRPANYFEISFTLDGYYDIDLKRFDTSAAVHLRFDKLINLLQLK